MGLIQGQIFFYEYDTSTSTLQYLTLIECRNRQGTYHEGRKITSMEFLKSQSSSRTSNRVLKTHEELSLLVTTNDNRIRLFSLADYSLVMKYKCPYYVNNSMLIRASLSPDREYVISGNLISHAILHILPCNRIMLKDLRTGMCFSGIRILRRFCGTKHLCRRRIEILHVSTLKEPMGRRRR